MSLIPMSTSMMLEVFSKAMEFPWAFWYECCKLWARLKGKKGHIQLQGMPQLERTKTLHCNGDSPK